MNIKINDAEFDGIDKKCFRLIIFYENLLLILILLIMQKDLRISELVRKVLNRSLCVRKGEKVYLEFEGEQTLPIMEEFIRETVKLGAVPFYFFNDTAHHIALLQGSSDEQVAALGRIHAGIMEQMDAYVVVRGYSNPYDKSILTAEEQSRYSRCYMGPVHMDVRMKKRWCVLRYPTNVMASLAKMSTKETEDFYFGACLLDYERMSQAMTALADLMSGTDQVHIAAPGTNLNFSIKGVGVTKSHGLRNLPDGEVFTAPVRESVYGTVTFNTETKIGGDVFSGVRLQVSKGRVVHAELTGVGNLEKLRSVIDTDDGARYFGEFAFGVNPYITRTICENLFDEKIAGSFHLALGNSIGSSDNGNRSSIHWDLVQIQTPEHGGGEIWFDGVLVRKDGCFVLPELQGLNPENLI